MPHYLHKQTKISQECDRENQNSTLVSNNLHRKLSMTKVTTFKNCRDFSGKELHLLSAFFLFGLIRKTLLFNKEAWCFKKST